MVTQKNCLAIALFTFATVSPSQGGQATQDFWWWNGGYDPFAAMHATDADWPHLESQSHWAPLKFSESTLSPLVPYTAYVHNTRGLERQKLTITDWQLNPVEQFQWEAPSTGSSLGVWEVPLTAPSKAGTYLVNLETYYTGNPTPRKYKTGIMVLPKRLNEPRGLWGVYSDLLSTNNMDPYHDRILDMFQAAGISGIREDLGMPQGKSDEQYAKKTARHRKLFQLARDRNITTLGHIAIQDHPNVFGPISRNQFVSPRSIGPFLDDVETMTKTFSGLLDWFELGAELNERDLAPYAEILKKSYQAARAGDPGGDFRFTMAGGHVLDQPVSWQRGVWQMEKNESNPNYQTYQNALSSHLYPELHGVEPLLRSWLSDEIGPQPLRDKGMIMTEGGWHPFEIELQDLMRNGQLPADYSGELDSQTYIATYGPVLLGEHLKVGAELHGTFFFKARQTAFENYLFPEGIFEPDRLRQGGNGHFVSVVSNDYLTVARPMVYTHNTLARLLTHEVTDAEAPVSWDANDGRVESYAYRRPGETIQAVWIGPPSDWQHQPRAKSLQVSVPVPDSAGLVLAVDINGNERVLTARNGSVSLSLTRPQDVRSNNGRLLFMRNAEPTYLRFLDGARLDNVFLHDVLNLARSNFEVVKGTVDTNPSLTEQISRDRNLPVLSDVVPGAGSPMVLHSPTNEAVYIVGKTQDDVNHAERVLNSLNVYETRDAKDAGIGAHSDSRNKNSGGYKHAAAGRWGIPNDENRALLAFDLPDGIDGSDIHSALMTLHVQQLDDWVGDGLDISVYRMTQDWQEGRGDQWRQTRSGVTWNSYDGLDNGNHPWPRGSGALGNTSHRIYATTTVQAVAEGDVTPYTWQLTDLAQDWADGAPNFGLLLKGTGGLSSENMFFHTVDTANPDWRPQLSIIYSNHMVLTGDINADGSADNLDITPLIHALTIGGSVKGQAQINAFLTLIPGGNFKAADANMDQFVDNLDITPFINILAGAGIAAATVPEPTSALLLAGLVVMAALRRRQPKLPLGTIEPCPPIA